MQLIIRILGNIVFYTFLAGALIVCAELVWYRVPVSFGRKKQKDSRRRIALITGASSGLGRAYAALVDRKLAGIDEIWLVARRKDRLREAAAGLSRPVRCFSFDLTSSSSAAELRKLVESERVRIRLLVNCAGTARTGSSEDMPVGEQINMLALNGRAAMMMTDLCLPYMGPGDTILNVCSTAAFQPLPRLNVYAASKAFLLRYSRALRLELLPRKIRVTAVCPYWIRDTEFISLAQPDGREDVRSFPLASETRSVARLSFAGARLGLPVVTPGVICTAHRLFSKLLPDTALAYIWEGIRRIG